MGSCFRKFSVKADFYPSRPPILCGYLLCICLSFDGYTDKTLDAIVSNSEADQVTRWVTVDGFTMAFA